MQKTVGMSSCSSGVAATAGVAVTGAVGTVEGMGAVGMVVAGIGAVVPTGGVTRTPNGYGFYGW
jgi:hypothetical protein